MKQESQTSIPPAAARARTFLGMADPPLGCFIRATTPSAVLAALDRLASESPAPPVVFLDEMIPHFEVFFRRARLLLPTSRLLVLPRPPLRGLKTWPVP
ncbi:MAG TPA: hypothetical protein VMT00_12225 [Thermoanaerobaculia bacterium]|nr:hypothetical protein [Thermoanaerobaculia bacterium]